MNTVNWLNHLLQSRAELGVPDKEPAALLEICSAGSDTKRSDWQFVCCQPYGEERQVLSSYLSGGLCWSAEPVFGSASPALCPVCVTESCCQMDLLLLLQVCPHC